MEAVLSFIDIERFVSLIRDHKEWFYLREERPDGKYSPSTRDSWLRYIKLPAKELVEINKKLDEKNRFETINIADFLINVNVAKDHNRGKMLASGQNLILSSDAKKVLQLILLGRLVENDYKSSKLTVYKNDINEEPLYEYLSYLCGVERKSYYYLPGRTVSLNQIKALVREKYSANFTDSGIEKGIDGLLNAGLLKRTISEKLHITKESNLFKLDYNGCYDFLRRIKPLIT